MDSQEDPKRFLLSEVSGDTEEDDDNSFMKELDAAIRPYREAWRVHSLASRNNVTVFTPRIGLKAEAVIPVPLTTDEDFNKLIEKYDRELRAYVRRSLYRSHDEEAVKDIMQQSWAKAWDFMKTRRWHPISAAVFSHVRQAPFARQEEPEKEEQPKVRAWLYSIVLHNMVDYLREEKARHLIPYDPIYHDQECDEMDQPEIAWMYKEYKAEIDQAIEKLPEPISSVLKLLCKGYTNTEIAKELGCPYGTVGSYVSRGRKYLRNVLATKKMRKRAKLAS